MDYSSIPLNLGLIFIPNITKATHDLNIKPIGQAKSCYKEKFGIPRQPGLVPLATASIILCDEYNPTEMVRGLQDFSHIWLLFSFHATINQGWKSLVRPPRLGGNERVGVLASRSMFRPNGLGLSVCKLESINYKNNTVTLIISGVDILDGTPIFDIKPYLPYSDSISNATAAYAENKPPIEHKVVFSQTAKDQCIQAAQRLDIDIFQLIEQILSQDPRPAFHQNQTTTRIYGMKLYDLNVRWLYNKQVVNVLSIC